jgi:hypothetical protein
MLSTHSAKVPPSTLSNKKSAKSEPFLKPENSQLPFVLDWQQPAPINTDLGDLIDGILIVTLHQELLYVNESARRSLAQLASNGDQPNSLPMGSKLDCQPFCQEVPGRA